MIERGPTKRTFTLLGLCLVYATIAGCGGENGASVAAPSSGASVGQECPELDSANSFPIFIDERLRVVEPFDEALVISEAAIDWVDCNQFHADEAAMIAEARTLVPNASYPERWNRPAHCSGPRDVYDAGDILSEIPAYAFVGALQSGRGTGCDHYCSALAVQRRVVAVAQHVDLPSPVDANRCRAACLELPLDLQACLGPEAPCECNHPSLSVPLQTFSDATRRRRPTAM